jgi:hypothetical protein
MADNPFDQFDSAPTAPAANPFDQFDEAQKPKPIKMPDGSLYTGQPFQDAILKTMAQGPQPGGPSALEKAVSPITRKVVPFIANPDKAYGEPLGDWVMDKTNSPALATAARLAPTAASMIAQGAIGRFGAEAAPEVAPGEFVANEGDAALNAGFRTGENQPIAKAIAGESGKQALNIHAQKVADSIAANEAGVPAGVKLDYGPIADARAPANAVYNRFANALPEKMVLDDATLGDIDTIAEGNRISSGSPDVQARLQTLRDELATQEGFNGHKLVNEVRALRQEGNAAFGSDDVDQVALGKAKLAIAARLEKFAQSQLPADADVSAEQLADARVALAKNHTVESALHGNNVDMGVIARAQRNNPDLLTGGLRDIADFANKNPAISGLASRIYEPPSYATDVLGSANASKTENFLSPSFWAGLGGGKAAARRLLIGSGEVGALDAMPDLAPLDTVPRPPEGMTASPPTAPSAPAPNNSDYAAVLSQGVEHGPAPEFTASTPTAPAERPADFSRALAELRSSGLSLAHDLAPTTARRYSDLSGVMSSQVPTDIMTRTSNTAAKLAELQRRYGLTLEEERAPALAEAQAHQALEDQAGHAAGGYISELSLLRHYAQHLR